MYPTTYHRARTLADAVEAIGSSGDGKLVSGGMTLIPTLKARLAAPTDLVDLRHLPELRGTAVSAGNIGIGAGTTHFEVASDPAIASACPALAYLAGTIGDPHVRHMGTIGGSIANNDPAADYPSAALALDAVVETSKREIAAANFFVGLFETALEPDEIVTAVRFRIPERAGYAKFPNPASRYAVVGVFVAKHADGVRVAVTGAGDDGVFRPAEIEAALSNDFTPEALGDVEVPSEALMTDVHASAQYRAHLIVVMARRAVAAANECRTGDPDLKPDT